jgi:hypothetical protein
VPDSPCRCCCCCCSCCCCCPMHLQVMLVREADAAESGSGVTAGPRGTAATVVVNIGHHCFACIAKLVLCAVRALAATKLRKAVRPACKRQLCCRVGICAVCCGFQPLQLHCSQNTYLHVARVVVCNCAFEGDLFGVKARHSLAWAQWQPANKQRQLWRMLVSARLKAFVSTVAPIQSFTACTSTSSRQEFDGQTADHDHVTHICAP